MVVYGFVPKDQAANFKANIVNNNKFKFFKYKARLLEKTVTDIANEILRDPTLAVH